MLPLILLERDGASGYLLKSHFGKKVETASKPRITRVSDTEHQRTLVLLLPN